MVSSLCYDNVPHCIVNGMIKIIPLNKMAIIIVYSLSLKLLLKVQNALLCVFLSSVVCNK